MLIECKPEIEITGDEHHTRNGCYIISALEVDIRCPLDGLEIGAMILCNLEIRPGHEMDAVDSEQIDSEFSKLVEDPEVVDNAAFACRSNCRFLV